MTLLYLTLTVYGTLRITGIVQPKIDDVMAESGEPLDEAGRQELLAAAREHDAVTLVVAVVGLAFFAVAAFSPRTQWAWIYGFFAIIGSVFPLCVTFVVAIPLLIFWIRPETKRYFARESE